jgi:hypothetical protein
LSQSKFLPCCTVVGARAFGAVERSRSRTRARVTKGRSQSCLTRQLRIVFVDSRIGVVLLGPQYGFPRSRVGLAWEHLFIQARSASKGIRGCTFRAEHDCSRPHFRLGNQRMIASRRSSRVAGSVTMWRMRRERGRQAVPSRPPTAS